MLDDSIRSMTTERLLEVVLFEVRNRLVGVVGYAEIA